MESVTRTPYQGLTNIIRFNWHFYAIAGISVTLLVLGAAFLNNFMFWLCAFVATGIGASTCVSLVVSHYVYDRSGVYDLSWLKRFDRATVKTIINIHAGFDETSSILKMNFPGADLHVFDFYDPDKHTELSIDRARKAYRPYDGTVKITTSALPFPDSRSDITFNIFALHEVRDRNERIHFLKEQVRAVRDNGKVVVVEHLRDLPNFLAYNIGFFHFFPAKEWTMNFQQAGFHIYSRLKVTPFVSVFILTKA